MKKLLIFLSLLSLLAASMSIGFGQGRPRRVGNQSSSQSTSAPESTAPAPAPSKPPVLGGSNYPNNRKPEQAPEETLTGPEEVDAGDIIRVNSQELLGLRENQTVTIRGKARLLGGSMLVIDADGVYSPR